MLTVENRNGHVIEQVDVGSEIARSVRQQRRISPHAFPQIGSEQTRTLVWAAADSARQEVIRARAIGGDTLKWEVPVDAEVLFPRKPFANHSSYRVENIYAGNTDGRVGDEIYALLNHTPYFPGLVVELDSETGAITQTYVHPGHLTARIRHTDLNGDGQAELITGGYSNAFDCPVVVVLDAEDFSGYGPATVPYIPAGVRPAAHYEYMRLPASPVQQAAPKTTRFTRFTSLVDGGLRFRVEDGTQEDEMVSDIELFLRFNRRLRPVSVVPNTQHERLAEELVASGRLEDLPGPETFRDYMKAIRYWNGENWQSSPAKQ